ncbi:MAG: hypothetical protein QXJ59_10850 [Thermofilaceae archaeon]
MSVSEMMDRLTRAFFECSAAHSSICTYPEHGRHYRDEVRDCSWFLHGHLIARYAAPRLWISHAGYPTLTTFSRLRAILNEWKKRVGVEGKVHIDVARFLGKKWMEYAVFLEILEVEKTKEMWYVFPKEGLTLLPRSGGVEVLVGEGETRAEEVLPPWYPADAVLPHVGRFIWRGGSLFFARWGGKSEGQPYIALRSADDLRRELEKLGRRTKVVRLLEAAASSGLEGVVVVLELLGLGKR